MTAKPEAAADATSTAHSTPAGVSHTLDSELTSAGYGRQFEVVQEELAAHLITASAVMRRGLPAQMMIVCASVIFFIDDCMRGRDQRSGPSNSPSADAPSGFQGK